MPPKIIIVQPHNTLEENLLIAKEINEVITEIAYGNQREKGLGRLRKYMPHKVVIIKPNISKEENEKRKRELNEIINRIANQRVYKQ